MIDCRSETGITIGLIDSIISISRILVNRDIRDPDIIEALKDLQNDEDLKSLLKHRYEIVGTTYDGVKILKPATDSKNFDPEEVREIILKHRAKGE